MWQPDDRRRPRLPNLGPDRYSRLANLRAITRLVDNFESWYLRLPGGTGHPWAGVVRIEAMPTGSLPSVIALANRTAATLPRFASPPHRDARAPANLLPIAGLEDTLHHLLGDRDFLQRRLRQVVAGQVVASPR